MANNDVLKRGDIISFPVRYGVDLPEEFIITGIQENGDFILERRVRDGQQS